MPLSLFRGFCAVTLITVFVSMCPAANPSYVDEFPSVERVLKEIQGKNARDTQARQVGALGQLWSMVASIATRRTQTPDESRLRQTYNVASGKINQPMMASFDPADDAAPGFRSPRAKWVALCSMYEHDEDLREEILRRFFSADFQRRYGAAIREGHRVVKHSAAELSQEEGGAFLAYLEDLPWYKGPAVVLAVFSAGVLIWFLLLLRNELRPFGLDAKNSRVLRAGRRRYDLAPVTGILIDERKVTTETSRTTTQEDPSVLGGERTSTLVRRSNSHRFNIATPDGGKTLVWLDHHRRG